MADLPVLGDPGHHPRFIPRGFASRRVETVKVMENVEGARVHDKGDSAGIPSMLCVVLQRLTVVGTRPTGWMVDRWWLLGTPIPDDDEAIQIIRWDQDDLDEEIDRSYFKRVDEILDEWRARDS